LPDEVTARLAADLTGVDLDRIVRLTVGSFDPDRPLQVAAVSGHVLSEAARVDAFEQALVAADLVAIGHLLDESHWSLRRFGVSTANLDRLTAAMRDAGALGARLTGAGFGGYALAAASRRSIEAVIRAAERSAGGPAFEAASAEGTG
jgi:galactokinase